MTSDIDPALLALTGSKIEILISCNNLADLDEFTKSDPMCVMFIKQFGQWKEYGRTEAIRNTLNPRFVSSFIINLEPSVSQHLKFSLYDIDSRSQDLKHHDFVGFTDVTLDKLLNYPKTVCTTSKNLRTAGDSRPRGMINITTEILKDSRNKVSIHAQGHKLDKKGLFSMNKPDVYLEISRSIENIVYLPVYRTEIVYKSTSPRWRPVEISLQKLCNTEWDRNIEFSCWHFSGSNYHLIGRKITSLRDMNNQPMNGHFKEVSLSSPKKEKSGKKKPTYTGSLRFYQFRVDLHYTLLDFIRGGLELNLVIAIDFTIRIDGDKWLMLKAWYHELVSQVKMSGGLSRPFPEKQGARQGGVWSPTAYKIFVNPILNQLHQNGFGCYIGSIYCGAPTVADDICLASNCPYELQAMLDLQEHYACQENYTISETKSTFLVTGNQLDTHDFMLNGSKLKQSETATHLGISRDSKCRFDSSTVVQERIGTARRATCAMMGAGLHGANGLNPCVSLHLIRIYIVPRLTYGLESIRLAAKDLTSITKYHKRLLKQLQHLPDKAADSASYLLLGEPPIKAEIHKRIFTTFGNIVRNFDSIEHQLAWRQLATKPNSSNSWFIMVKTLLEMYDLPSCYDLLQNPPGKSTWKNLVKSTVNSFWEQKLKLEAKTKSSLKFIDIDRLSIGKTHLIWSSAGSDTFTITKASVNCRMLLGVYTLQANRHRFNQFEVDPSCPLCKQGPEDRTHFLVLCQHFTSVRQPFMEALKIVMRELLPDLHQQITSDPLLLTQVILDCSSSPFVQPQYYNRLECLSRGLCYALHIARSTALEYHYK
ncbi:unnamed protein product [Mytilus coruscus]|uniref:C2 domain-containing protein n=1 Tax=Mytilus coruscus TaxID=42192 RepID=A0A6J8A1L7_MYTCO|nr:unnamed protein product [Mytilus coruscus]